MGGILSALLPPGEGGAKRRMRDPQALRIPHPAFGNPLPVGAGPDFEKSI